MISLPALNSFFAVTQHSSGDCSIKLFQLAPSSPDRVTWTPDWLSVSGRLVVECPPGVGHLGGCPVGEP